jgi:hypothetical protein
MPTLVVVSKSLAQAASEPGERPAETGAPGDRRRGPRREREGMGKTLLAGLLVSLAILVGGWSLGAHQARPRHSGSWTSGSSIVQPICPERR